MENSGEKSVIRYLLESYGHYRHLEGEFISLKRCNFFYYISYKTSVAKVSKYMPTG
jgi:hypothetical protein